MHLPSLPTSFMADSQKFSKYQWVKLLWHHYHKYSICICQLISVVHFDSYGSFWILKGVVTVVSLWRIPSNTFAGAPPWSSSSVLDHRSLLPVVEYWCGHIWKLSHLWLHFITLRGNSAHLAYHVHKSGRKTSFIKYAAKIWNDTDRSLILRPHFGWLKIVRKCEVLNSRIMGWQSTSQQSLTSFVGIASYSGNLRGLKSDSLLQPFSTLTRLNENYPSYFINYFIWSTLGCLAWVFIISSNWSSIDMKSSLPINLVIST